MAGDLSPGRLRRQRARRPAHRPEGRFLRVPAAKTAVPTCTVCRAKVGSAQIPAGSVLSAQGLLFGAALAV